MRDVGIVGILVVVGCHGAGSAPAGGGPIVWHTTNDGGTVSIDAAGVVTDACGEVARLDRAGGMVRITRGPAQTLR
jgi:hypothetical protein